MENAPIPEWRKPIISVPLQQAFPQIGEVKEFKNKVCLFNHDRSKLLDVVSPRYQVIQHSEAFDQINSGLMDYFETLDIKSTVRSLDGGVRIRAEFKLPIAPIKLGRADINEITMVMQNSYDRSLVFSAELGAFRLICSNGMKIGQSFGSIKLRHLYAPDSSTLLEDLDRMIARAPLLKDKWEEWSDTKISFDEALDMVGTQFPEKYVGPILIEERFPETKWQFYNDLTRFATHDVGSVRRRMEFDDIISRMFYSDNIEDAELVD